MANFRGAALAAVFIGSGILTGQAQACDSNYPWLCKPVPPVESSESAEPAAKPLPTTAKRRTAVKTTKPATERLTRKERRAAQKAARRAMLRSRQARAERTAEAAEAEAVDDTPVVMPRRRPNAAGPRVADAEPGSGFMAAWTERTGVPAQPVRPDATVALAPGPAVVAGADTPPPAAEPPAVPVRVAAQNEINELDLAAAEPPPAQAESSWLRNLFLAFGGLIAFGSAVRLFI